jgi:ADP-L-glycero-D-manno-heptose 6-epimerase
MTANLTLVTGGAGFIGSNIVHALAHKGRRVVISDWLETGDKWRNIASADVHDIIPPPALPAFLSKYADRIEAVVHMGAISATTERDGDKLVENNLRLTLDLWAWCAAAGARFIYASSAAVYGDGGAGFEDDWTPAALARLKPLNAYGWSKLAADRRIAFEVHAGQAAPPHWAGLRFFNVYGPNEYHKGSMRSVVHQIAPRIQAGEPVRLFRSHNPAYEDGGQLRDFVHVGDCVAVIAWLLEAGQAGGVYNLGTGKARSFKDLALAAFRALDAAPRIEYVDTPLDIRDKYQYFTQARMDRLRAAGCGLNFQSLEDGVAGYIKDHLTKADPFL